MPTEPASEGKDRGRERTQTRTEGTELVIEFTVVYYGHGRIYTTKTCGDAHSGALDNKTPKNHESARAHLQ